MPPSRPVVEESADEAAEVFVARYDGKLRESVIAKDLRPLVRRRIARPKINLEYDNRRARRSVRMPLPIGSASSLVIAIVVPQAILVLEKHGDFLRDFRGDTIHPSILEILDELGLAERFLVP
jgi:hypothetical protein